MTEFCPAEAVAAATEDNAEALADRLVRMLTDPSMPEPMRRDVRCRLQDLHRRFPQLDVVGEQADSA